MLGKLKVPAAAAFGGVFPILLQVTIILLRNQPFTLTAGYAVAIAMLAGMGAGVALIWGEKDLRKAFYLGIGLPSLVQATAAKISDPQLASPPAAAAPAQPRVGALTLFAAPAFAQPPAPPETPVTPKPAPQLRLYEQQELARSAKGVEVDYRVGRTLQLQLEDIPSGTEVVFSGGSVEQSLRLEKPDGVVELSVPDFAEAVFIRMRPIRSEPVALPSKPGAVTRLRVDGDTSFWGGFFQALGVRSATGLRFEVKLLPP